ncbi:hypothetical protein PV10_02541 [Exophiala mesophila]|uniref:UBC core domain-containing protein n=1 Tax=Exophiala mesophila TaxID=212818 RepID=A0A0D1ZLI9_EXOME|nr:uncharacterized protein PV10_02541 [Exophiala mesophila]KIV94809.1 hypothetical protein PV10_02541 [Exophiala mesophila]
MGRKVFLQHLEELSFSTIPDIENVHNPDEGVVSCRYTYHNGDLPIHVQVQCCTTDLDQYPDGNSFMLFTDSENLHDVIPRVLESHSKHAHGKVLSTLLTDLSLAMTKALTTGIQSPELGFEDPQRNLSDASDFDFDIEEENDWQFGFDEMPKGATNIPRLSHAKATSVSEMGAAERRWADLRAVKDAGFRVGVHGDLSKSAVLCVSIRVGKLGLSEEVMQAWKFCRKKYLLLMISYPSGYRTLDYVVTRQSFAPDIDLRIGLCQHYKPCPQDINKAFQGNKVQKPAVNQSNAPMADHEGQLEPLFIGKPMLQLMQDFLPHIIQSRLDFGLNWLGAEKFVLALGISSSEEDRSSIVPSNHSDARDSSTLFAPVANADHFETARDNELSLPLVAMQFLLRHVIRCTEFCLVCHCPMEEKFEALKPYVCSKPLCLYQYMSLGFGPEIEWEIKTQPYVVDLLISFCYVAACQGSLKVLPVGLNVMVPLLPFRDSGSLRNGQSSSPPQPTASSSLPVNPVACDYKSGTQELHIKDGDLNRFKALRPGAWLVLVPHSGEGFIHCCVDKIELPTVYISFPDSMVSGASPQKSQKPAPKKSSRSEPASRSDNSSSGVADARVDCCLYENNFDDLAEDQQHYAIKVLLETLPSVQDMCDYLEARDTGSLSGWKQRISDSALSILRWIIASNRSYIMQVDGMEEIDTAIHLTPGPDEVREMDKWIQFRFAQGAPDKENRFVECMKKETSASRHPSLWAWHGSNLGNWHSIVRQGLRYDRVVNGRAYGNGVYMSPTASTSLYYSGPSVSRNPNQQASAAVCWKHSALNIRAALSLNEVVNRTDKFVSNTPHYVVANIDWVQTRYLFVRSDSVVVRKSSDHTLCEYEQAPGRPVLNELGSRVKIPVTAVPKSRRPGLVQQASDNGTQKRSKMMIETDLATAERMEDDAKSITSDEDDLALLSTHLADEGQEGVVNEAGKSKVATATASDILSGDQAQEEETDFVPGMLNVEGIIFLSAPKNATTSSSQALMRSFREMMEVQESTPASKLGWYIDPSHVSNLYQWIVELHSFPRDLPLSKDMKAAGLTSLVLEVRFQPSFPFTPPFIRVVSPRFLPFQQGGGGNVTEGGAMCMEVLTNSGWTAALSMDSILLQVRLALSDEERPARLINGQTGGHGRYAQQYGTGEAMAAYRRACRNHGWLVPDGFDSFEA